MPFLKLLLMCSLWVMKVTQSALFICFHFIFEPTDLWQLTFALDFCTGCDDSLQGLQIKVRGQGHGLWSGNAVSMTMIEVRNGHRPNNLSEKLYAVVTSEIKLKQNKCKTMLCFSEIVLFQFRFCQSKVKCTQRGVTLYMTQCCEVAIMSNFTPF